MQKFNFEAQIWSKISNQSLIIFKSMFGLLIAYLAIRNIYFDFIKNAYINCEFFWPLLPVLYKKIPKLSLFYFNFAILIFGIQIMRHKWGSWAYIGFLLSYLPIFGFNYTYYQDYQLLIIIISVLLALTQNRKKTNPAVTEAWEILTLKVLFSTILFWRTAAYLNSDWLSGTTYNAIIQFKFAQQLPFLAQTLSISAIKFIIIFGLPIFESTSAVLPWKTKKYLPFLWLILIFYCTANSMINSVFLTSYTPILLILLSTLFLSPTYPTSLFKKFQTLLDVIVKTNKEAPKNEIKEIVKKSKIRSFIIYAYIILQLLIPLNIYFVQTNFKWEICYPLFAWTMKMQLFESEGFYTLKHPLTHQELIKINCPYSFTSSALCILAYGHKLRDQYQKQYGISPDVYADIKKSINKRPLVQWTDPTVNLSKITHKIGSDPSWISPMPKDYFK
jgi:hypothetical protein